MPHALAAALLVVIVVAVTAVYSVPLALVLLILLALAYMAIPEPEQMCGATAAADKPPEPETPGQLKTKSVVPEVPDAKIPVDPPQSPIPSPEPQKETQSQWLPSQQGHTFREKQREEFKLHRAMRRDTELVDRWSEEDKEKYEQQRRNVEFKLAKSLRPDPYMITKRSTKMSDTLEPDYPFASVHAENNVWHSSRYRTKMDGVSERLIANLQSNE